MFYEVELVTQRRISRKMFQVSNSKGDFIFGNSILQHSYSKLSIIRMYLSMFFLQNEKIAIEIPFLFLLQYRNFGGWSNNIFEQIPRITKSTIAPATIPAIPPMPIFSESSGSKINWKVNYNSPVQNPVQHVL